jgi:hypothetical protein
MEPFTGQRSGRYRPKLVTRAPRCIPDQRFDQLFAQRGSHRDRALVALWVSTGALVRCPHPVSLGVSRRRRQYKVERSKH